MKKILKQFVFLLLITLTLVGCSTDVTTKITDADDVVVKFENKEVVKQDLYQTLIKQYGANQAIREIMDTAIEAHVKLSDKELKEAEKTLAKQKKEYADNFKNMIKGYGFKNEKEYFEEVILNEKKNEKLKDKFVEENYEALVEEFSPKKIQYMVITNEEASNRALEMLSSEDEKNTWDEVADKFASDPKSAKKKKLLFVNPNSEAPQAVQKFLQEEHEDGLVKKTYLEEGQFYIYNIIEQDGDSFKKAFMKELKSDQNNQLLNLKMLLHFAEEFNLEAHDSDVYNGLKQISPELVD